MTSALFPVRDLARLLSPGALITDPRLLPEYGRDFWTQRGIPGAVVRPRHTEDVVATLRFAQERGIPVVPRAAGTNIGGGFLPAPDRLLLDLRAMHRVLHLDPQRRLATVQPGLLNGALQEQLAPLGLCYSPDPASAPLSSIGGNIAENAGGPHCLKYGVTFHHVAGIECVLPGGRVAQLNAADGGPDLLGVLIGSEGTLAVVTEARLALRPLPPVIRTLLAAFDRAEDAAQAVSAIIAAGVVPAALEFFDRAAVALFESHAPTGYPTDAEALILVDMDGAAEEVAHELPLVEAELRRHAREVRRADTPEARAALWRGRLHAGQAKADSACDYFIGDTTVPRHQIPAMLRAIRAVANRWELHILTLGHAGDGNLHPTIAYNRANPAQVAAMHGAARDLVSAALELGGALTGEHGVGSEKRDMMRQRFSAAEIAAMRAVKAAFDPHALLNPGVLLPDPQPDEPALPRLAAALQATMHGGPSTPPPSDLAITPGEGRIDLDTANLSVTVDAAVTPQDVRRALQRANLRCPALDDLPPNSPITAAISLGANRLALRNTLLGVDATLNDGHPVRFGSSAIKDVAGYDLKRLYLGGEGACGSLQRATLRLWPRPPNG